MRFISLVVIGLAFSFSAFAQEDNCIPEAGAICNQQSKPYASTPKPNCQYGEAGEVCQQTPQAAPSHEAVTITGVLVEEVMIPVCQNDGDGCNTTYKPTVVKVTNLDADGIKVSDPIKYNMKIKSQSLSGEGSRFKEISQVILETSPTNGVSAMATIKVTETDGRYQEYSGRCDFTAEIEDTHCLFQLTADGLHVLKLRFSINKH